jgi:hypothetical protein
LSTALADHPVRRHGDQQYTARPGHRVAPRPARPAKLTASISEQPEREAQQQARLADHAHEPRGRAWLLADQQPCQAAGNRHPARALHRDSDERQVRRMGNRTVDSEAQQSEQAEQGENPDNQRGPRQQPDR